MTSLAITLIISLSPFTYFTETGIQEGVWKGVINYEKNEVPFNFEIDKSQGGNYIVTLMNREERIEISNSRIEGDSIIIPLHIFHTEIRARIYENRMEGYWKKYYRQSYKMPFKAEYGINTRYDDGDDSKAKDFSGKWVTWLKDADGKKTDNYWITLIKQNGSRVNATVLTEVGDFRYMEGVVYGNEIFFSSFDGVHAFVFNGKLKKDSWSGLAITDIGEYTEFICEKDSDANFADPFEIVQVEPKKYKADFTFYDPEGKEVSSSDPYYRGKVLVVQLFGTWCPNSMDATNFLKEYYTENQVRGVEVIALAYETSSNAAYGYSRIKNMQEIIEIEYPVAYAGSWSKSSAAEPFPVMDRIKSFPTLVIIDKEGYIRKVNSFFMGPATDEYYDNFKEKFNDIVDELLEE